jgi:hypothetical protein
VLYSCAQVLPQFVEQSEFESAERNPSKSSKDDALAVAVFAAFVVMDVPLVLLVYWYFQDPAG